MFLPEPQFGIVGRIQRIQRTVLIDAIFQQAAPVDGEETPMGIWSRVICLLEEWASPKNWGMVGAPEAMELVLCKMGDSLGELSVHAVAGTVG